MSKKVIIVGGVAGGASTAARLRRLDENCEITMFEKGEHISFANCGLPYYIGDVIKERSKLIVQTKEAMAAKFNINIKNFSEVIGINKEEKKVTVKNLKTGEVYEESYDVLVLSPGAKPIVPPIEGLSEAKNLFTLRNIPDTDMIKGYVTENKPSKAVIVGGGFIGLEMAENLHSLGIGVSIVEMSNQVMAPLDIEMAQIVHEHLIDKGVNLILEDGVKAFANNGKKVILTSGKEIDTDMIILSIGVQPETKIAVDAGLKTNARKAIVVDEYMRTSDENIYALGDAVEITDYISKTPTMIPLAWPANRQGRIVADNISGRNVKYPGTLGTSVAKVFDITVSTTGNNEKSLKRNGIEYNAVHIHPASHASYYPGAFPISLKLLFNPKTGHILGAQAVGIEGAEKRIDVIATAIKGNLTVFDLQNLELSYAPPYSSAKDPVNMAGYTASNLIEGMYESVQYYEVDELIKNNEFLLDVREPMENELGTIDGSVNIPLGTIRESLDKLPKDKTIYAFCQVGLRGYLACRLLTQLGYKCKNLDGGYKTYTIAKYNPLDKQPKIKIEQVDEKIEKKSNSIVLDACGLQCPGPIRRTFEEISKLNDGDVLEVRATDSGFQKDIKNWCDKTGNKLLSNTFDAQKKAYVSVIEKGSPSKDCPVITETKDGATMVVFSGDLDKAIASFIIATGAASMGKQVTMFFTFWGLNILKKKNKPSVKKNFIEKMFDMMLPKNTDKLPLSKMQMAGMGPKMIKYIMKKNNVDSLDTLIDNALNMGVKVVACSMSMDLMGIKKEELLDGVEVAGVASYLSSTEDAGVNLFI